MEAIARRRLHHLLDQGLGVAEQQFEHRPGTMDFLQNHLRRQPKALARALHHGLARRGLAAAREAPGILARESLNTSACGHSKEVAG